MNELEIVTRMQPEQFAIRTTAGPTPFVYCYRFAAENGETVVHLEAQLELAGIGGLLPGLAGRAVKREVDDNLATSSVGMRTRSGRPPGDERRADVQVEHARGRSQEVDGVDAASEFRRAT